MITEAKIATLRPKEYDTPRLTTFLFFAFEQAWGRTSGGSDASIRFLSDGSGALTRAMGLVMDTPVGIRTKRFSLIADNGVVTHYFNAEKQSSDTWAPNVLAAL